MVAVIVLMYVRKVIEVVHESGDFEDRVSDHADDRDASTTPGTRSIRTPEQLLSKGRVPHRSDSVE
jgi:hypothetical protein